jgi:uncharacterized protein DUF4129
VNGRLLRAVPLAALLLGLLALVALASRAGHERSSLPSVPGPPPEVLDYGLTVAIALAAIGLVLGLRRLRLPKARPMRSGWQVLGPLLASAAAVTLGVLIARRLHIVHHGGGGDAGGGSKHLPAAAAVARERSVSFHWPVAVGVFAALAIALVLFLVLQRTALRPPPAPDVSPSGPLSEAFDESLDDLRFEPDPRKAVIAAYARAERDLERHGLPRRPSEAPLEYLSRVLLELRVRAGAVLELTDLFERAKFSTHRVDESMRQEAIAALVAVRDDLAGAAA